MQFYGLIATLFLFFVATQGATLPSITRSIEDAIKEGDVVFVSEALKKNMPVTPDMINFAKEQLRKPHDYEEIINLLNSDRSAASAATPAMIEADIDYIDEIKRIVRTVKYAPIPTCMDTFEDTNCSATAGLILRLFIDIPRVTTTGSTRYKEFLAEESEIAKKFFSIPHAKEHVLYIFTIPRHEFLIEKKSNATTTWWRVYQGWGGMFNSKDWLGKVDDWKIKHRSSDEYNYPLITELHTKYGNGNQLNKEQIKDFLEKITKVIRWSPITIDLSEYTVYEYNVDPNVYKQLPKRFK